MAGTPDLTFLVFCLPFAGALVAPLLTRLLGASAAWWLALAPAAVFMRLLLLAPSIAAGETVSGGFDWVPSLGIRFSFYLDGLSLTFALLITGIGTLIVLYAGGYMKGHAEQGRFFSFIFLFMGSMLGLVVADDFLTLFVFWELTSITSFLLIGFDHERAAARRAAFQALVVTGGGGLLLLAGLLLIRQVTGIAGLSALLGSGEALRQSPFYLAILVLVLGGAFTKSAQVPFHVWLPNAMEAPTPVSAYLHSATMVKAGVYLLMRLNPVMGGTSAWQVVLPLFGGATLVTGAVLAIRQTDLKLKLAYTTVSSLGLLVLLTGVGSQHAIAAAVLYLVAHSLFKGALFMVAGIIDHETGSRDSRRLGGLRSVMPLTFAVALAAALSMGGLPPFFGFLAKEEIYTALIGGNLRSLMLTTAAVVGNALMFAVAFAVGLKPFVGPPVATPRPPHEAPALLLAGPAVLSLLGLAAAIVPAFVHRFVSTPMASAVRGEATVVSISLVPHAGLPLALSGLTIALGIFAYWQVEPARRMASALFERLGPGLDRGFDALVAGLVTLAVAVTRRLQPGRLGIYVTTVFLCVAAVLWIPPVLFGELPAMPVWPSRVPFHEIALLAIAVIGLAAVIVTRDRLTAIVSLGIQGFALALIYLLFGAPDLSFTQFMVETLSVVILTLVMTRLQLAPVDRRPPLRMAADGAIALACGLGFALLLLRTTEAPFDTRLSDFFAHYSRLIAHGQNVVNVIIVDFRGTDTLGEIAVVTIAALAILTLIRQRPTPGPAAPSAVSVGRKAKR